MSGGIDGPREIGAVVTRIAGGWALIVRAGVVGGRASVAAGWVPCGERARGSGSSGTGGTVDDIRVVLSFLGFAGFASRNIKSSDGSGGSGLAVATSSMSSFTAVDSVFFSAIACTPLRGGKCRRGELRNEGMGASEIPSAAAEFDRAVVALTKPTPVSEAHGDVRG